jgi:L-fuculose-phosphate aldolase
MESKAELTFVGIIRSELKNLTDCPKQGHEGAPAARVDIYPEFRAAMKGLTSGSRVVLLTWFHRADREALKVHPRGNPEKPLTGVFLTRSPNRPNPIGLHEVRVLETDETGFSVEPLEALDNTPVIDIKLSIPNSV